MLFYHTNVTRPRCPVCGTRLNQDTLEREVEFGDDRDVITRDIMGGRGSISTTWGCSFESPNGIEYAKELYEKVENLYMNIYVRFLKSMRRRMKSKIGICNLAGEISYL